MANTLVDMDKTAIIIVIIILASCGRGESSRKEKPGELKGALRNTLIIGMILNVSQREL